MPALLLHACMLATEPTPGTVQVFIAVWCLITLSASQLLSLLAGPALASINAAGCNTATASFAAAATASATAAAMLLVIC